MCCVCGRKAQLAWCCKCSKALHLTCAANRKSGGAPVCGICPDSALPSKNTILSPEFEDEEEACLASFPKLTANPTILIEAACRPDSTLGAAAERAGWSVLRLTEEIDIMSPKAWELVQRAVPARSSALGTCT